MKNCSITNEKIEKGFVFRDGEMQFKNESELVKHLRSIGVDEENDLSDEFILKEAYELGEYYYTEWEEEEEEQKDLFEHYEDQPEELQRVLKPYEEHDPTYESLKKILKEVEAIGYTFNYGLDAYPYNLRKM